MPTTLKCVNVPTLEYNFFRILLTMHFFHVRRRKDIPQCIFATFQSRNESVPCTASTVQSLREMLAVHVIILDHGPHQTIRRRRITRETLSTCTIKDILQWIASASTYVSICHKIRFQTNRLTSIEISFLQ